MQEIVPELQNLGATLVALTPQLQSHSKTLVEKHGLSFDLLSDPGNAYAEQLGIRYVMAPEPRAVFEGFGIDMAGHNGDDSWSLPMPARLVVDQTGVVRAADVDPDYTRRPEPQKTLDDLRAL